MLPWLGVFSGSIGMNLIGINANQLLINIIALIGVAYFISIATIHTKNIGFYNSNKEWFLQLPIKRKDFYKNHFLYVMVQMIEVHLALIIFSFVSIMITPARDVIAQSINHHEIQPAILQLVALSFEFGQSAINLTLLLITFLLFIYIFFTLGIKVNTDAVTKDKIFYKKLAIMIPMAFLVYAINQFFPIPLIFVLSVLIAILIAAIYHTHFTAFKLQNFYTQINMIILSSFAIIYFLGIFAYSNIRILNDISPTHKLSEMSFLGILSPRLSGQTFLELIKNKDISPIDLDNLLKIGKFNQNEKFIINTKNDNFIKYFENKKSYKTSLALLSFINFKTLTIDHFSKLIITLDKNCPCSKKYFNRELRRILKLKKLSRLEVAELLAIEDLSKFRLSILESAMFSKHAEKFAITALRDYRHEIELDITRGLNIISLLLRKEYTFRNYMENDYKTRRPSSLVSCGKIQMTSTKMITSTNIGDYYYCSNQKHHHAKSYKYKAIYEWNNTPDKSTLSILKKNLLLKD